MRLFSFSGNLIQTSRLLTRAFAFESSIKGSSPELGLRLDQIGEAVIILVCTAHGPQGLVARYSTVLQFHK